MKASPRPDSTFRGPHHGDTPSYPVYLAKYTESRQDEYLPGCAYGQIGINY
jgi:hypothetical protein